MFISEINRTNNFSNTYKQCSHLSHKHTCRQPKYGGGWSKRLLATPGRVYSNK